MSENIIMDDFFDDFNARLTFRDYVDMVIWKIKSATKSIYTIPRKIKWAYQRVTRGYSDRDMWSADYFLASQIAGMLNWIVNEGHGVSTSYGTPPNYEDDVEDMVARRDAEYLKYSAVFAEYAKNGPALNEDWKNKLGGVLDKDLKEALQWFSEHFTEFWD
jgi:hypothetical protein